MPEWINNVHAGFVLAAYTVAAAALMGLAISSLRAYRRRAREWAALSKRATDTQ